MATSFLTAPPAACFDAQLTDIRVTTDADFVVCTVRDAARRLVVQLKSYPYNGEAVFSDLRSIAAQWLTSKGLLAAAFSIAVRESTFAEQADAACEAEMFVAHCSYGLPVGADFDALVSSRFLTTLQSNVIYPGTPERLALIAAPEASRSLLVEGFVMAADAECTADAGDAGANGTPAPFSYELLAADAGGTYETAEFTLTLEDVANRAGATPLAFTCKSGNRLFTFYAAKEPPPCVFLFRNIFNAIETAAFFGTTTAKQEVEREEAVSGGITSFYDSHTVQSYEVESAALAPDLAAWLAQLFSSPDVRLFLPDTDWADSPRILITESTFEVSDDDTAQRRVKFTWRYAADAPQMPAAQLPRDGVFTEQYNPLFT